MIGSIVYATEQGLGYLAKDFFDNGIIDRVYIQPHGSRTNFREWYPTRAVVDSPEKLLEECSSLIFFEEVFHWKIIPQAREKGIKTALMPMYECTRSPLPYEPDIIITPSALDQDCYPSGIRLDVPVSVPWKERTVAKHFVHNAGNLGLGGRNGTKELLAAMRHVKSPLRLTVRSQVPLEGITDPRVTISIGTVPKETLWSEGDVFVFPEKFNGLSLPLQEAFASGMLVMAGDRFPINTWLPKEPLIPVDHYTKERIAREFDCAQYTPEAIAQTMDAWYGRDITEYSHRGREYNNEHTWTHLKEAYRTLLLPSLGGQDSSDRT